MGRTNEHRLRTTGVVLCGGLARRLGGVDKGLHVVAGRPLVAHVLDRLRPQVCEILINANRNREAYAAWGHPVVADESDAFDGPLAGVLSALRVCRTDWLVSVPCDAPQVPVELVDVLLDAAASTEASTACAHDGVRLQPTFCAYRRSVAADLADYLDGGERKIDCFLEAVGMARADFSDQAQAFVNLNAPDDVARFESSIR